MSEAHHGIFFFFFSELCWGKAMVAYTMPQETKKKEGSERLRGETDQIKFIDLGFESWQVVIFRKARGRQDGWIYSNVNNPCLLHSKSKKIGTCKLTCLQK